MPVGMFTEQVWPNFGLEAFVSAWALRHFSRRMFFECTQKVTAYKERVGYHKNPANNGIPTFSARCRTYYVDDTK